jgi:hypothetical protein
MATDKAPAPDKPVDDLIMNRALVVAFSVLALALLVVTFYVYRFHESKIGGPNDWGAFGDYIGGVINPIVGLGTVLLILLSISLQRREFRASVEALREANTATKLQSIESSLFAWLKTYQDLVASVQHDEFSGRKAMDAWHRGRFSGRRIVDVIVAANSQQPLGREVVGSPNGIAAAIGEIKDGVRPVTAQAWNNVVFLLNRSCHSFEKLYATQRWQLDAVFRTLYRLLHWIDQSDLAIEQKWHYVALVRAQLSWIEMIFIFYDGLSPEGKKLALLVNKYALLDNLSPDTDDIVLLYVERMKLGVDVGSEALPTPERTALSVNAFDSEAARSELGLF